MAEIPNIDNEQGDMFPQDENIFNLARTPIMEEVFQMRQFANQNVMIRKTEEIEGQEHEYNEREGFAENERDQLGLLVPVQEEIQLAQRQEERELEELNLEIHEERNEEQENEQRRQRRRRDDRQEDHQQMNIEPQEGNEHQVVVVPQIIRRRSPRNQVQKCGLSKIANWSFDIVGTAGFSTFNFVSEQIYRNQWLPRNENREELTEANRKKAEANIKRRVYDALNVMVSIGCLEKNGKTIGRNRERKPNRQERAQMEREREKRRSNIAVLQRKLENAKAAVPYIQALFKRNQRLVAENHQGEIIQMPIGLVLNSKLEKVVRQGQKSYLELEKEEYQCYDVIQSLVYMNQMGIQIDRGPKKEEEREEREADNDLNNE